MIAVVAQFFCGDGVGDVGVADDVRVLARRRGSGSPDLAARQPNEPRARRTAVRRDRRALVGADDPDVLEQRRRLPRRHVDRGDRPLHRVRAPDHPALARRARASSAAPGASASTTSGSTRSRSSGSRSSAMLFLMPITPTGIPWKTGFDWNVVNYAPITVGGALLLFGGWYVLSAHKWFKGPVRAGHRGRARADRVRPRRRRPPPASRPARRT